MVIEIDKIEMCVIISKQLKGEKSIEKIH